MPYIRECSQDTPKNVSKSEPWRGDISFFISLMIIIIEVIVDKKYVFKIFK
jgi:hypothetical protein